MDNFDYKDREMRRAMWEVMGVPDDLDDDYPFPPTEIPDEPEYLRELDEIRAKELCLTTR